MIAMGKTLSLSSSSLQIVWPVRAVRSVPKQSREHECSRYAHSISTILPYKRHESDRPPSPSKRNTRDELGEKERFHKASMLLTCAAHATLGWRRRDYSTYSFPPPSIWFEWEPASWRIL